MKIKLASIRIAFPALFEPKSMTGQDGKPTKPKFSAAFIVDPKTQNAKALAEGVIACAKAKWGAKADAILAELHKKDRVCYRESPLSKDGKPYEGFEGMHSINASNDARPLVLDRTKSPLTAQDGKPYGGCYVNASIELWAQDNKFGKRINASLKGVQFVKDGDAFGGGAPASPEEFEDLGEGAQTEEDEALA